MPCRGPEPWECDNANERVRVANHLLYLLDEEALSAAADLRRNLNRVVESHGWSGSDVVSLDRMTATLCSAIRSMPPELQDTVIYNGRSARARDLASWFERHEELDRRREAEEQAKAQKEAAEALKRRANEALRAKGLDYLATLPDELRDALRSVKNDI